MNEPEELVRRVATLDDARGDRTAHDGPGADLRHFLDVLGRVNSSGTEPHLHHFPGVFAASADAIVAQSRLLARLTETVPELVTGPLRFDSQYWVGTNDGGGSPEAALTLSQARFVGVEDAAVIKASTKPFDLGLFTATGVVGGQGMWRMVLDPDPWSELYGRPWHVWKVEPRHDAAVLEITSASQWVDFVLSHPLRARGLLFPDWKSVARHYDAVHVTLRAIAAIQGIFFATEQGLVADSFWDVESTLWFCWCFDSVKLVEVVEPLPEPSPNLELHELMKLVLRVSALDHEEVWSKHGYGPAADLAYFISRMASVNNPSTKPEVHPSTGVSAATADTIVAKSQLLTRLTKTVPEIVTGPLRFDSQYWWARRARAGRPRKR
jgi:hypothetical protein